MDSLKAWIEQRPKRAVMVTAVVALIIGLVLGLGAGYKIEHDRVASDVKKAKKTNTTASTKTPKAGTARAGGKVSTIGPTSIVVKTKTGTDRTITLSAATKYETAAKAAKSDITKGRHVFVVAPGIEILVLPEGSTLGRAVTDVTADSIKLGAGNGLPGGTIHITATTAIESVKPGSKTDVKVGVQVLALGTAAKAGPIAATDVITLPDTSKFGG
jgi:hypothetical protein